MSLTGPMIDAFLATGGTVEQLAAMVKADLAERAAIDEARMAAKRDGNRERQRRRRGHAPSRVVTPVTRDPNDIYSNPEELPQEAKASLPQGAKTKREAVAWPCPAGVNDRHWQDFLASRKRKRCVHTQTALDGVLADIARIADDEWPPGRLVQHAAAKGWASINDPRKPMNGQANGGHHQHPGLGKTSAAIAGLGDWNDDRPM